MDTLLMTLLVTAPIAIPTLAAATYAVAGWGRPTRWVATASAVLVLLVAGVLAAAAVNGDAPALGQLLRVDAASAYLLVVIASIAVLAALATPAYLAGEITAGRADQRTATRHSVLVQAFLATMALAVVAADLGLLWVAMEATTIATAFLVGQRRTREAVEAAWKYVVICSAGIALALLGIVLLNYASAHSGTGAGLDLAALAAAAPQLDPGVTRIAVVLLIVGFGAKAGLAPLHAWLPDAHSQAPAPVSALMSGVLLSVAFYAVLRVQVISDGALGPGFARALLLVAALASLLVAASLLIAQRDYKRMLAYSSIEHMGLLALGAAAGGPLATAAVLLHMLGHGLAKCVLFLGAGRMLQTTGTSRIDGVRGLVARQPALAGVVGFGVLALMGLPPFSVFASELGIARAGFASGIGWATAAALALVVVAAAAMVGHTSRMLLGPATDGPGAASAPGALPRPTAAALVIGLLGCAVLGVTTGPLAELLSAAAGALGGPP
jgi:hydrogenase-4 component F